MHALKNDSSTFFDVRKSAEMLIKRYDLDICSGSAIIVDMHKKRIDYAYTAGGLFFKDTFNLFKTLNELNYQIFIASGDNKDSLLKIASILNVPKTNVFDTCNINCKKKVVCELQKKYNKVIMVGNNTNDLLAIKQADIGILTIEQGEQLSVNLLQSSDYVINKIGDVLKIVED